MDLIFLKCDSQEVVKRNIGLKRVKERRNRPKC